MNSPDPFSYVNAQLEAIVKECSERLANIDYDYMMEDIISTKNAAIAELREQITGLRADLSKAIQGNEKLRSQEEKRKQLENTVKRQDNEIHDLKWQANEHWKPLLEDKERVIEDLNKQLLGKWRTVQSSSEGATSSKASNLEIVRLKQQVLKLEATLHEKEALVENLNSEVANHWRPLLDDRTRALEELNRELRTKWILTSKASDFAASPGKIPLLQESQMSREWELTHCTVKTDATWFPSGADGSVSGAACLRETAATNVHLARRRFDDGLAGHFVLEVHAKADGRNFLGLWLGDKGNNLLAEGYYDLERGAPVRKRAVGDVRSLETQVRSYIGDWFVCRLAATLDPGERPLNVSILSRSTETGSSSFDGDVGRGLFIGPIDLFLAHQG